MNACELCGCETRAPGAPGRKHAMRCPRFWFGFWLVSGLLMLAVSIRLYQVWTLLSTAGIVAMELGILMVVAGVAACGCFVLVLTEVPVSKGKG